jgi:hypothetical protein
LAAKLPPSCHTLRVPRPLIPRIRSGGLHDDRVKTVLKLVLVTPVIGAATGVLAGLLIDQGMNDRRKDR